MVSSNGSTVTVAKGDSPDISADGRVVAYVDTTLIPRGSQAVVISSDGGGRREVTDVTVGSVNNLAISPDGRRLAYTNNTGGVSVLGVDGSGKRLVADADAFELDWSPDGTGQRRVASGAYPSWTPDGDLVYLGGAYYRANADGSDPQPLDEFTASDSPIQWARAGR